MTAVPEPARDQRSRNSTMCRSTWFCCRRGRKEHKHQSDCTTVITDDGYRWCLGKGNQIAFYCFWVREKLVRLDSWTTLQFLTLSFKFVTFLTNSKYYLLSFMLFYLRWDFWIQTHVYSSYSDLSLASFKLTDCNLWP